jgi:hypothetical protein
MPQPGQGIPMSARTAHGTRASPGGSRRAAPSHRKTAATPVPAHSARFASAVVAREPAAGGVREVMLRPDRRGAKAAAGPGGSQKRLAYWLTPGIRKRSPLTPLRMQRMQTTR